MICQSCVRAENNGRVKPQIFKKSPLNLAFGYGN